MDMLQGLLGGGQQRQEYDDFINRYNQGAPYDGIGDDETFSRYRQVAVQAPPDVYEDAAYQSYSRMSPMERMQFGQYMQQQAMQRGVPFQDFDMDGRDDRYQDPRYLAQMTSRMHQREPGLFEQLLGGGGGGGMGGATGGGMFGNPLGKAAMAGITAMVASRVLGGR